MTKLIDQSGVADLVAKRVEAAVKGVVKSAVAAVKQATAMHVSNAKDNGDKALAKALASHGADVVTSVKAAGVDATAGRV